MAAPELDALDVDGALRETSAAVQGDTRASFLARSAVGAGGLIGGGVLMAALPGVAAAASKSDVAILNFALGLEYLERDFYATALSGGAAGTGDQAQFATTAHIHETLHVTTLQKLLGSEAIAEPTFNFGSAVASPAAFLATAIELEDLGVRAYKGQLPAIEGDTVRRTAIAIHTVEATHASWARFLSGEIPTYTGAFETPLSMSAVQSRVNRTGFVVPPPTSSPSATSA
jgi:Ferritin-like domain